ncbi:hypothetical protein [Paucibacter sp. DJ2R-2]|uniref:hypothetical protein n=1 Tax=Paucibacter sp. DJ2R-2 TaxID=2893558 RepID=UPI0021E48605|nr:hypothetical protein [Paucibacter sp. DJ2R-2]MCV2423489.1 hypothetical protein [Paucibacter sp. DJ4R-1]MCV2440541.1 hypothetical protein [Paucibacter sp. DJ2R-2]
MQLSITYELVGSGWSKCTIEDGEESCSVSASYLSDALGNLVVAAFSALSGFASISFGFDEEPGEYRWVIEQTEPNQIQIQILEFEDLWGCKPNADGKVLLSTTCRPLVFAAAVQRAAAAVLAEHGEEGYLGKWMEHPFPIRQLSLLSELVAARE